MLQATKASIWGNRYTVSADGRPVAEWNRTFWRAGGEITLTGSTYRLDASAWTNRFTMTDAAGATVATAERAGRKHWTVVADGTPHRFRRASIWSNRQDLLVGDSPVGSIRRTGFWNSTVEADLPTLSLPVQVFVVGVMITTWDRQAAAAGS